MENGKILIRKLFKDILLVVKTAYFIGLKRKKRNIKKNCKVGRHIAILIVSQNVKVMSEDFLI